MALPRSGPRGESGGAVAGRRGGSRGWCARSPDDVHLSSPSLAPGWTVDIDLEQTSLAGQPYTHTDCQRSDSDWVMSKVSGDVFQASWSPLNLGEVLRLFRD